MTKGRLPTRNRLGLALIVLVTAARTALGQTDSTASAASQTDSATVRIGAANLTEMIGTRFPGATVIRPTGLPGLGGLIRIRGRRSLVLPNDPEIAIDGVLMSSRTPPAGLSASLLGDPVSFLDLVPPDDIERIDIDRSLGTALRDGAGLGNGVVRITTRRGRRGPPQWSAATEIGAATDPQRYPTVYFTRGSVPYASCTLADQAAGSCQSAGITSHNVAADPAATVLATGLLSRFRLGVRGGGDWLRYAVSSSLTRDRGVIALPPGERRYLSAKLGAVPDERIHPSGLSSGAARANLDLTVSRHLSIRLDGSTVISRPRLPFTAGQFDNTLAPLVTGIPADTAAPFRSALRPALLYGLGTDRHLSRTAASARADWRPNPTLKGWASVSLTADRLSDRSYVSDTSFFTYQPNGRDTTLISPFTNTDTIRYRDRRFDAEAGLAASAAWNAGAIIGSLGVQYQRRHPTFRAFHQVEEVGTTSTIESGSQANKHTLGAFIAGDLQLGRRFHLETTLRRDQPRPTDFAKRTLWGGGASARWNGTVSFHGSWSVVQRELGVAMLTLDPFVGRPPPEEVREVELGADASFWRHRGRISVTGFRQLTRNGLIAAELFPPFVGARDGGVRIRNQGVEVEFAARLIDHRPTTIDLHLTGATLASRIQFLDDLVRGSIPCTEIGEAPFTVCGYPTPVYRDANGDGIIARGEVDAGPQRALGPTLPKTVLGAGFDFATGMLGGSFSVATQVDYLGGQWSNHAALKAQCISGLCQDANDPATPIERQAAALAPGFVGAYAAPSSFVRLREVVVSWRTGGGAARAVGAKQITFAVIGRNLALASAFKGWDPEVQTIASDLGPRQVFPVPLPRSVAFRFAVDW